jgi:hypothetical protein
MRRMNSVPFAFALFVIAGCGHNPATPSRSVGTAAPATSEVRHEQAVPFSGSVSGYWTLNMANPEGCPAAPFTAFLDAAGTALHMGEVTLRAVHCVNMQSGAIMSRAFVITAANGDELRGSYTAQSGYPAPIDEKTSIKGTFTFDGGTGRFSKAHGTARFEGWAISKPPGQLRPAQWEFTGTINY